MALKKILLPIILAFCGGLYGDMPSNPKIRTLYNSLDLKSISQHLVFYDLYPNTAEGKLSLQHVGLLLSGHNKLNSKGLEEVSLLPSAVNDLVSLTNRSSNTPLMQLSFETLDIIDQLANRLSHRKLKGHDVTTENEILNLPPEEIDLARGIFITQMGEGEENIQKIRSYEALLDLMALQIIPYLPPNATPPQIIRAINRFVFEDMGFRFPPHSTYAKDIDLYTFLPSVLDSRRGVCLGVSILYMCLAQRLDLPLEMVTPPGHIFVRFRDSNQTINIETTARGIHLDSEEYLGVETRSLQQRNIKESIGLAYFNQASVHWKFQEFENAYIAYTKAKKYLPDDKLLMQLLGYICLLTDRDDEAVALLQAVKGYLPDHAIASDCLPEDYLNGYVGKDGIKAVFMDVDETRQSILKKQDALTSVVGKYPLFRDGIVSLAVTFLQLHRYGKALEVLESYHLMDQGEPVVEYYLAELFLERYDYPKAWKHLNIAESLVKKRDHYPEALLQLRKKLTLVFPLYTGS